MGDEDIEQEERYNKPDTKYHDVCRFVLLRYSY